MDVDVAAGGGGGAWVAGNGSFPLAVPRHVSAKNERTYTKATKGQERDTEHKNAMQKEELPKNPTQSM